MGEKKRREATVLNGPCPCGSSFVAHQCCFNGHDWHKPPAALGLRHLTKATRINKCYMQELGSCVGPITREHLISKSVVLVLKGEGEFSISGVPWLEVGEKRIVGPENLTGKCLCSKHNSALHPLDDAAKYFFSSLKSYLESDQGFRHTIISGHDLERWLLKTAKALAATGNLANGRKKLKDSFVCCKAIPEMLDDPMAWPDGTGLYCTMNTGELTVNHPRFQFQPLTNNDEEIEAIALNILGLNFILQLKAPDLSAHPSLHKAYRPSKIMISRPRTTDWITLSWDDNGPHFPFVMHCWEHQAAKPSN